MVDVRKQLATPNASWKKMSDRLVRKVVALGTRVPLTTKHKEHGGIFELTHPRRKSPWRRAKAGVAKRFNFK